jgi:hypothetical protein
MQTGSYIKAKAPEGAHAAGDDLLRGLQALPLLRENICAFASVQPAAFIFGESYSDAP